MLPTQDHLKSQIRVWFSRIILKFYLCRLAHFLKHAGKTILSLSPFPLLHVSPCRSVHNPQSLPCARKERTAKRRCQSGDTSEFNSNTCQSSELKYQRQNIPLQSVDCYFFFFFLLFFFLPSVTKAGCTSFFWALELPSFAFCFAWRFSLAAALAFAFSFCNCAVVIESRTSPSMVITMSSV